METEKTSVFRQCCREILFIFSRSLGFMNLDHGCSNTRAVFQTSPHKLQLSPEGCFAAKLLKCLADHKTSSDLPAALGWVDNDWIFCLGWTYPLTGVFTAQVVNIYSPKLRSNWVEYKSKAVDFKCYFSLALNIQSTSHPTSAEITISLSQQVLMEDGWIKYSWLNESKFRTVQQMYFISLC